VARIDRSGDLGRGTFGGFYLDFGLVYVVLYTLQYT